MYGAFGVFEGPLGLMLATLIVLCAGVCPSARTIALASFLMGQLNSTQRIAFF